MRSYRYTGLLPLQSSGEKGERIKKRKRQREREEEQKQVRDTRTTSRTLISSFVNAHLVFYDEDRLPPIEKWKKAIQE